jgi:GntR family transcriptional regulator
MGVDGVLSQLKLDFRSNEPLYLQLVRQIEQLVAHGDLPPGTQLPTVRELATELRINFNTVSRAYRVLDETRLISTQRGRGTYIWEQPTEEMMDQLKKKSLEELARGYLRAAVQLGYTLDQAVEELKQLDLSANQAGEEADLDETLV